MQRVLQNVRSFRPSSRLFSVCAAAVARHLDPRGLDEVRQATLADRYVKAWAAVICDSHSQKQILVMVVILLVRCAGLRIGTPDSRSSD